MKSLSDLPTEASPLHIAVIDEVSGRDLLGVHDVVVDNPKKSPLHDLHVRDGATVVQFEQALWVDRYPKGLAHEYLAIKSDAGILDVSLMAHIELSGQDAVFALQHFFTNDLVNAADDTIRYGALVGHDGKVIDDCLIYKFTDRRLWLFLNINVRDVPIELFVDWEAPDLDAVWTDLTEQFVKIQLQGPASPQILQAAFPGVDPTSLQRFRLGTYATFGVTIGRCGFSGEDGFELIANIETGRTIWDRLISAGATPYGISAIEYCRVEAGLICNEHEYVQGENFPQEIGLERFVKSSVAEHIYGYPHLAEAQPRCSIWTLLFEEGLHHTEKPRPANGSLVHDVNGEQVGELCSVVFSPRYQRYLAIAKLDAETVSRCESVHAGPWQAVVLTFREEPVLS